MQVCEFCPVTQLQRCVLEKRDSKIGQRGARCGVEGNGRVPGVDQQ